ncbi:MAG: hypothetical protein ABEI52_01920 [Halobacteriaceae archaeon]
MDSLTGHISVIERELSEMKSRLSRDDERFREAAGAWSDIDAEAFKKRVYEERNRSSREKVEL